MEVDMFRILIGQILLCGMFFLGACAATQTGTQASGTAAASGNIVVSWFAGAELQTETRSQLREIRKALNDMLALPVPQLQARRYADYQMKPDQWTLDQLLNAYFLSASGGQQEIDSRFYKDIKKAQAQDILREKLREVEAAIPDGAGE
jgi:uncharacterized membrane protein